MPLEYYPWDDHVVGTYAVGRGRVCAGAVIWRQTPPVPMLAEESQIADCRKLSMEHQKGLRTYIEANAIAWGVGYATAGEVDTANVGNPRHLAMHRALAIVYDKATFDYIVVGGNSFKAYHAPNGEQITHHTFDGCDNIRTIAVAAASILATTYHNEYVSRPNNDKKYFFA